jgi:hypothetical protein
VPRGERRVEPLDDGDRRTLAVDHRREHRLDRALDVVNQVGAALGHAEREREVDDARLDLGDPVRVERHDLGVDRAQGAHLAARDGAHLAEVLRHDHVRPELGEQRFVDGVERAAAGERGADGFVDLAARERRGVHARRRHHREAAHDGRPVALGRDADDPVGQPQPGDDLGRAR